MEFLIVGIGSGTYGSGGTALALSNLWEINKKQVSAVPTEEQISGTVVTDNVSGTYEIDWSVGSVFILTMTADTTFTFANQTVRPINIILTGAFVPILPTMILRNGSDAYDGAVKNLMEVNYLSADNITYINENLPT